MALITNTSSVAPIEYSNQTNFTTTTEYYYYYDVEDEDRFTLPWWQQLIFISVLVTMIVIATGGNIIVIWIVLAHKRMRTVTNYFIVNLAIADALISVFNVGFTSLFLLYQDWWFGEAYCKFNNFISVCTISASVLTFMAIAVDRYMAIMHPLRPRMPKLLVITLVAVIWVISIALSIPGLVFAGTQVIRGTNRTVCHFQWELEVDFAHSMLLFVMNYVLPLVILSVTYIRIGCELWGSRAIGEDTPVQWERVKSKRKVVKMMIIVVVVFALCWLPQHLYFIIMCIEPLLAEKSYTQQIYIVIYIIAMSNSMYNPIIYCWMNSRFREGFISVFCWCPCGPCKKVRTRLRFRRTLFPTGVTTMSEKYGDRNGSLMHTMTDYVDDNTCTSSMIRRSSNNIVKEGKRDDYV